MMAYLYRHHAPMPFQTWRPFPPEAIVQVANCYGDNRIDIAKNLWWGYEWELGQIGEGVIIKARRLDRPKRKWQPAPVTNGETTCEASSSHQPCS